MLAAPVGGALLIGVAAWIAMTCLSVGLVVGGNGVVNGVGSGVVSSGVVSSGVVIGGIVVGVVNGAVGFVGVVGVVIAGDGRDGGVIDATAVLIVGAAVEVAPSSSNKKASCLVLIVLSGGRTM